jgi:hypothetical protein
MLRPIVRFCFKNSIAVQEIIETLKLTLVDVAQQILQEQGEKVNVSRVSVITGLHRRDVIRLFRHATDGRREQPVNLISRIIGQWEQDPRFLTKSGKPRILGCDGPESEFVKLVHLVSSDLHSGTILFQLERLGLVRKRRNGLQLLSRNFDVRLDLDRGYQIMAHDVDSLINAVSENLGNSDESPHLHARTEYDNIFKEDLPVIKQWVLKEGAAFHKRTRNYLSKFDKDINPHIKKDGGASVVIGTFSFTKEK